jgi:hypothetical protein
VSSLPNRLPDEQSEHRLLEIRREAERRGRVDAPGVAPKGAPFPQANARAGYYGIPMLKEPQWTWEIPLYFFVGGAAGSSAVIGAMARWVGRDPQLARHARLVAAAGGAISSGLLISDLGRPSRFLNMLRVFKAQSPMSVGAWTLAAFGTASGAAAFAQLVEDRFDLGPVRVLGNIAEAFSVAFGLPFSNYTGVLIGATAIPVWNENVKTLPLHFGMSGLNSGVSILELLGNQSAPLNLLGILASAIETWEGFHIENTRRPAMEPLKHGISGWMTRSGGVLSGPVPLALRLLSVAGGRRRLRRMASYSSLLGSLLTRYAWMRAGHASAKDYRLPLEVSEQQAEVQAIPVEKHVSLEEEQLAG